MKLFRIMCWLRVVCVCGLFLTVALSPAALAYRAPWQSPLPNYDQRVPSQDPSVFPSVTQQVAVARLQATVMGLRVTPDPYVGSPKSILSVSGFVTLPADVPQNDPTRPVRQFMDGNADLFGHGSTVLTSSVVKADYVTAHNGLRTTVWQQQLDGISVFEGMLSAHITRRGELVNVSSRYLADVATAADAGTPGRTPTVTAVQAVVLAAQNINVSLAENQVVVVSPAIGAEKKQQFTAPGLGGRTWARLIWLPMKPTQARLCWQVELVSLNPLQSYRVVVDAVTGIIQIRRSTTVYLTAASYNVFTSDSPAPFSPGCPTECTTQAPVVPRELVTLSAVNTDASPDGWIPDADNTTIGNNVNASTDLDGDITPDAVHPIGNPARVFDFPMDLAQGPQTYSDAAVVQLFYRLNWMHDKMWELGFNEAAGNFQMNNFGKGGVGGDPVLACAQSAAVQDNAFMMTPDIDGQSPTMVMGVFTGPTPNRDADLDSEVMLHEYTHGISGRLVGGGNLGYESFNQPGGLGEGWSDFVPMAALSEEADDITGTYATGGYLTYQLIPGFNQNYYYGIRRFPYSTEMSRSPLTFKDIDPTQAIPHTGIPMSPVFAPFDASMAGESHNAGEVWCIALWEVRANLIEKYGWSIGNKLMLQLVIDGMKLTPATPTFLEARDAILQADYVNNFAVNQPEIWKGFAKRGMGLSAKAPVSSTTEGVVEAYDVPLLNCAVRTRPAQHTQAITRNSLFWFTHPDSAVTNSVTLKTALQQNGDGICLGFINLPVAYENSDNVKNIDDTVIETLGLYWRNQRRTGEWSGLQSRKFKGSPLCQARKKLSVELIAAFGNNAVLGTEPINCIDPTTNQPFPVDLIEQASIACQAENVYVINGYTDILKRFNSCGMANEFVGEWVQVDSVKRKTLKKSARDPSTQLSCPGPNETFDQAALVTNVPFSVSVKMDSYSNNVAATSCALLNGPDAVWKIYPTLGATNRQFTVTTDGSNIDTILSIWRADNLSSTPTFVECNDDDADIYADTSKVVFRTDGGGIYYIVGTAKATTGKLKLKVTSP